MPDHSPSKTEEGAMIGDSIHSRRFSLCKAISWRLIGSTDTFLIAWLVSGAVAKAGLVAIAEFLTKPALFYLHERAWARFHFGIDKGGGKSAPSERRRRSIVKAVSWRVLATIDTTLIAYIVTGSFSASVAIGTIEVLTKSALYYYHERLWNRLARKGWLSGRAGAERKPAEAKAATLAGQAHSR